MTFDKWIDEVNASVRQRLGRGVQTEELSWDGAVWRSARGTAVAALADDGVTAKIFFDGGDKLAFDFDGPDTKPDILARAIAERLTV